MQPEKFELTYDPKAVQETLRIRAHERGVKVRSLPVIPAGTRIGKYLPQGDKRKAYHDV